MPDDLEEPTGALLVTGTDPDTGTITFTTEYIYTPRHTNVIIDEIWAGTVITYTGLTPQFVTKAYIDDGSLYPKVGYNVDDLADFLNEDVEPCLP